MRLFTRYITFELLKVFVATLTGLTLFMLLVGVVREAHDQGLGFATIFKIIPYLLPNALRFIKIDQGYFDVAAGRVGHEQFVPLSPAC